MSRNVLLLVGAAAFVLVNATAGQDIKREEVERKGRNDPGPVLPFKEIPLLAGHAYEVIFSPDGSRMAVGSGATVSVYSLADLKEQTRMQLPQPQLYHRLAFIGDGKTLLWNGREDPTARIFDVKTGRQIREFPQHDPRKKWRELARAEAARSGKPGEGYSSSFLAYSPDGTRMAYRVENWSIEILSVATGKSMARIEDRDGSGCSFSPDGRLLAVHGDKDVRLWDLRTTKLVKVLSEDPRLKPSGTRFTSFSPDGNLLACWAHSPSSMDIWDLRTGKRTCTVPAPIYFMTVAFSRDNQSFLGVSAAGEVLLHNIVAEKVVHRFNPPERLANFAAFSPDEKKVIILGPTTGTQQPRQYSLFVYELPAALLDPVAARIDDVETPKLWAELQGENDLRLQLAVKAFRAAPKQAVALFRKEIKPVNKERQKEVEERIAELDDADFNRRDRAMKQLKDMAHEFAPLLEARHKAAEPGEVRNRLAFILRQLNEEKPPVALIRERRVINLLEQLATPEAREFFTVLAEGAPGARLTVDAGNALKRLVRDK